MKRSRPQHLVCQHVEHLSREGLERYADIIRKRVEGRPGVYALYRGGKLYYVGLATDLRVRLTAHLKDRHNGLWDRFSVYLTLAHAHRRELESLVLRIANPPGNRQRGKFIRSEDLGRQLERELRAQQQAEREAFTGRQRARPKAARGGKPQKPKPNGLAGRFERRIRLQATYKGRTIKGTLLPNGEIQTGRKRYTSPSTAAQAVLGRSANGWTFWFYERAPGDWVRLDRLRT